MYIIINFDNFCEKLYLLFIFGMNFKYITFILIIKLLINYMLII